MYWEINILREKLMTSHVALFSMSQAFSSNRVDRVTRHASMSARNRYVIDVGLVVENVSTVSSSRGNNDRWLDPAESSFKARRDTVYVLVDSSVKHLHHFYQLNVLNQRVGKIDISSLLRQMMYFPCVILFFNMYK